MMTDGFDRPAHQLARPTGETPPPSGAGGLSVLYMLNVALRYRRLLLAMSFLAAAGVATAILLQPRAYSATASFVPQSRSAAGGLSGLAAQIGVAVPGGDQTQSPDFYVDLVRSRDILQEAARSRYAVPPAGSGDSATLVALYQREEPTPAHREDAAVRELARDVQASASANTGVVTLAVAARSPDLAQQIATRLIDLVSRFNLESRQTQARAEREFTEARLREVSADLRRAEERLAAFMQRNRDYRFSPTLQLEVERLQRQVAHQSVLHTSLAQSFEQARLEEVRDTPVITLITRPDLPLRPVGRGLISRTLLAGLIGVVLAYLVAFAREAMSRARTPVQQDYEEFVVLRRQTVRELARPWRLFLPAR